MRLLLDEMYPRAIAEQLRERGYDAISIHDVDCRWMEGSSDQEVFLVAISQSRAIVTENVPDFCRLESEALQRGQSHSGLILTTNRQFPRGDPATIGRLVLALSALLEDPPEPSTRIFLKLSR